MTATPPATEPDPGGGIMARDVTVTYRSGLTALRHASFQIPRGLKAERLEGNFQ